MVQNVDDAKAGPGHLLAGADALYIRLSDTPIHDSEEVNPGIILDYDEKNNLAGIEILQVSKRVPLHD